METERKRQIITLSILVIAILALVVGFAAFSASLAVSSQASVNPNSADFKVVFSSSESTLKTDAVKANPESMGDDATIDNTTMPTISNLNAKFTAPGQSVTYTFYVRNEGNFIAYLNSISFRGKTCTAGEGTSFAMANEACSSITTTVSVGSVQASETKTNITGETLGVDESKQVTVTITYGENGARADGPFTVEFGDITMYYATVAGESGTLYTGEIYRTSPETLSIDDDITEVSLTYETNLTNISQNYYLKHEIVNNIVTASYVCITYTENGIRKDVCFRGGDSTYYASNQAILRSVEPYFNTLSNGSGKGSCNFDDSYSYCYSDSLDLRAFSDGLVDVDDGSTYCYVYSDGDSSCYEW